MSSKHTTYTQTLKLRWSLLLLAALVVFVLLANANQTQPPALVAETVTPTVPTVVAMAQPGDSAATRTDSLSLLERTAAFLTGSNVVAPPGHKNANRKTVVVKRGDTLSGILDRFNVHSSLGALLRLKEQIAPLLRLQPGNSMHLDIEDNKLVALTYERSRTKHLKIALEGEKYTVTNRALSVEKQEAHAFGVIKNSFYQAALEAGLSDKIIVEMANILGWDIDFVLDVRAGDQFSVVYEKEYLDGEKLRDGDIRAIEFLNNGKTYRAVRYTNADGNSDYFTPQGKNMRKPFLRNPIEYTRISSHFNPRRLHPIFKTVRPHRGVDYAASTGTPVRAAGDGRIKFRGKKAGYGNVVIVEHGGKYSTLYAHLSRFARGQRRGSRVRQKQTIGYVGMSGYATGPHLHYEFRVNNVHKNPLTVKLPDSRSLPKSKMAHFKRAASPVLAKLDTLKKAYASISSP